ncbi:HAD-IA family hydrolase [Fodinisporobacter ferrooxydans]|uniref:HAD-IA family hydrolase n=1 Tax=Fodinisporobacter ferrooxydans TaxID=2901836 RepID=A0ABY4CL95_9BACL|nr:HAD-IA family hydrolase [Alicyclobacillaceae bacterium MYW30-H2]
MTENYQPEAVIFDLDGTLFRAETILVPAYHRTFEQLRKEGLYTGDTPPEEKILGGLGMLLEQIWKRVMPDASALVYSRANELLLHYQLEELKQGTGKLYAGVETGINILYEQGYQLFVASNGLENYVKEVIRYSGLAPFFKALYSAGEFQTKSKVDLVRLLMETYSIRSAWMVGDRSSDVEAGKANGLYVVGCNYSGFGQEEELDGADLIISSFDCLVNEIMKTSNR